MLVRRETDRRALTHDPGLIDEIGLPARGRELPAALVYLRRDEGWAGAVGAS
jgi:hypothetical protein